LFCTYYVFSSFLLCCNASALVICAIKNYLLTYLLSIAVVAGRSTAPLLNDVRRRHVASDDTVKLLKEETPEFVPS